MERDQRAVLYPAVYMLIALLPPAPPAPTTLNVIAGDVILLLCAALELWSYRRFMMKEVNDG